MSLLELQRLLRRQGFHIDLSRLRSFLSDTQTFTILADDHYLLRDHFAPQIDTVTDHVSTPLYLPTLLLASDTYVVVDIEASGLEPQHDQIIQIAALQVKDGIPLEFREWDVQCDPKRLPLQLRAILHLTEDRLAQIETAPSLTDIWPSVQRFLGDAALVIHNARFDTKFLLQHDPSLANPVLDTMELALLVTPEAPRHNLETLAQHLNIDLETLSTADIRGVPAHHRIAADTLHDAVTDVLLLQHVYAALLLRWQATPRTLASVYGMLLPEVTSTPINSYVNFQELWSPTKPSNPAKGPIQDETALALLDRAMAHASRVARPGQISMVELVANALMDGESCIIEAPTGTGKTLGYLIPAVWTARRDGRRIALATAYKNLQDQLQAEVQHLQQVAPFNAQVLKGASSYLCLRNLEQAITDGIGADFDRRFVLAFLAHWAVQAATLDEIPYWLKSTLPVTNDIVHEVAVDRATCTERRCPFFASCHFFNAYRDAEQADLLLVNQALWLAEPNAMPHFDALIIDEAHNLEDVATSALRKEVSESSLRGLLRRITVEGTRRGVLQSVLALKPTDEVRSTAQRLRESVGQTLRLIVDLRATLGTFIHSCDESLEPDRGAQLRLTGAPGRIYPTHWKIVEQALDQIWHVYLDRVIDDLQSVAAVIPPEEEVLWRTVQAVRDALLEQGQLLTVILQAQRSDLVTWISVQTEGKETGWAFNAAPISVAPILTERYRPLRSVVLTSATLTTGQHDFSFFVERLGLRTQVSADHMHALDGALPYHTNVLLGLPTYLNYTPSQVTIESFVQELANELTLLFRFTDGRALVLFTARQRLEKVADRTAPELESHGIPVLAQRSNDSRQRLIDQFRTHGGAVLYGLRSFWEGVDIPGAVLSIVVMEKLPYPALRDPVSAARREAVARQSGREFQDYLFPLMVIQFKQGFGRLMRRDTDQGAVILYDKRIARKTYLPELLGALPGFQPRDRTAERSRRSFYELIAVRLPGLIDLDAKAEFLAELPDILITDLEALVARLALPDPLPDTDYDAWRPRILEALHELYEYDEFRSYEQELALRSMLTGHDVIAVLPTGAGKSLCFQLPALLRTGTTIICSPLIALMRDQIDKLHERGIEIAAALMSGQNAAEREDVIARVRAGRIRLLYLAPERLRDPTILALLASVPIPQIVVDEAHCVALWGPSFRPDFLILPQIYDLLAQRPPVAAFTATATPAIYTAITEGLQLRQPVTVQASINRPELCLVVLDRHHRYHPIQSKNDQIRRLLMLVQTADTKHEPMLIYVATTREAEYLARLLQVAGYAARSYHGKMPVQERADVSELFMEGLLNIVVCTKAFGMGIDKPDIRYVVHYNTPGDLEAYTQEVGRAGRDGQPAYAVLLYHSSDLRIQEFFIEQSRPDGKLLTDLWHWISDQPTEWTLEPQATCEQFQIDELELRRALYLLETVGLLQRGPDVTVRGNLTLGLIKE